MNAVISSRTPEGEPLHCPVCGTSERIEPSRPPGDAPCPCCGHLIQFSGEPEREPRLRFTREQAEHFLRSERRRPMFGVVATISRQVRRAIDRTRRRERRPSPTATAGVYDYWLDGSSGD